jgi:hypothetical protein
MMITIHINAIINEIFQGYGYKLFLFMTTITDTINSE